MIKAMFTALRLAVALGAFYSAQVYAGETVPAHLIAMFTASGGHAVEPVIAPPPTKFEHGKLLTLREIVGDTAGGESVAAPLLAGASLHVAIVDDAGQLLSAVELASCKALNLFEEPEADLPPRAECDGALYALAVSAEGFDVTRDGKPARSVTLPAGVYSLNGLPFRVAAPR